MNQSRALKRFYDKVGERYPEEEQVYRTLRGLLRKKFVLNWLKQQSGSLLDIGTNRGMYLAHYAGGTRYGVDLSLTVLKQAQHTTPVNYVVADAERLFCFQPESFDRVLCSEVIEHCFHPQQVFESIAHVLKPGGKALLTTPNYRGERPTWVDLGTMVGYGVQGEWNEKYFHTAYKPEELAEFARDVNLKAVEIGTLEKQVKYAAKIPAAFLLIGRKLNLYFESKRLALWNEEVFQILSLLIYRISHYTLLEKLLLLFVKQGVRSYIIMQKPNVQKNI